MTPQGAPYGTGAHPEVSEISDLTEGLLAVSRAQQVREHLTECPLCADVHDSLVEIRSTLGTLPGTPRMPADVVGRIDAALAAEALLDARGPAPVSRETGPTEPVDVSRETPSPPTRPTRAARPDGHPAGSSGPGRPKRKHRRRRTLLTTAGVLAVLGIGGAVFQGLTTDTMDASEAGRSAAQEKQADAGTLAGEDLERRVRTLLDKQPAAENSQHGLAPETREPEATAPLVGGPATVPPCVRAGIDRPEMPLAAESSRAETGRPSYLVVLPHPGDPDRVDAYVVDSSCATDAESGPGEVLVERTYRRE